MFYDISYVIYLLKNTLTFNEKIFITVMIFK